MEITVRNFIDEYSKQKKKHRQLKIIYGILALSILILGFTAFIFTAEFFKGTEIVIYISILFVCFVFTFGMSHVSLKETYDMS
jgi:FtsH-binding integral membrane protein